MIELNSKNTGEILERKQKLSDSVMEDFVIERQKRPRKELVESVESILEDIRVERELEESKEQAQKKTKVEKITDLYNDFAFDEISQFN